MQAILVSKLSKKIFFFHIEHKLLLLVKSWPLFYIKLSKTDPDFLDIQYSVLITVNRGEYYCDD